MKRSKKSESYDFGRPKKLINLFLSWVKASTEFPTMIEILSVKDNKTINLQALTERDWEEWIQFFNWKIQQLIEDTDAPKEESKGVSGEASSVNETANDEYESQMRALIQNNVCADCKAPYPEWFSHNLGLLLCITCSGQHWALGTHISKVRSLTLDTQSIETLEYIKANILLNVNGTFFESRNKKCE